MARSASRAVAAAIATSPPPFVPAVAQVTSPAGTRVDDRPRERGTVLKKVLFQPSRRGDSLARFRPIIRPIAVTEGTGLKARRRGVSPSRIEPLKTILSLSRFVLFLSSSLSLILESQDPFAESLRLGIREFKRRKIINPRESATSFRFPASRFAECRGSCFFSSRQTFAALNGLEKSLIVPRDREEGGKPEKQRGLVPSVLFGFEVTNKILVPIVDPIQRH